MRARLAADGDQNFLGFDLLLLAFDRDRDGNSRFRLLDFVDLRAGVEVDAALAEDAGQFLRDFFVFHGNQPRQHFDDRDLAIERAIDRSELDSDRSCANNHKRLRNLFQAENFDVGEHAVAGFEAGKHAGFRASGENDVLRLEMAGLVVVHDFDGEHAILRGAGQLAVALHGLDFILLHQELEALGVLGHDLRLAILDRGPVQLARVHALDAEFLGVFQVIPEFGIEQQRLGRNAAHVQAGAAEESVFFDERSFQALLAGANGGGVSGRSAADDGDVINGFRQSKCSSVGTDD